MHAKQEQSFKICEKMKMIQEAEYTGKCTAGRKNNANKTCTKE